MDAKIKYVILWPKNPDNEVRKIKFACKGVEVISGWSQKGKSALIHIVDYCLGSEKCAIPVGKVRDMVEWFGVVLILPKRKTLLIARRNPEDATESSDMMWLETSQLELPVKPVRTDSRDSVVERLNQLAGLPSRGATDEESSFGGPPSFRDMAAFNFQPQHIIANPYTLFFKADTSVHREKLVRSVLPYVLGAVDARKLNIQAELRRLEFELKAAQEQLEQCRMASEMWKTKLQGLFETAREYNLLPEDAEPQDDWNVNVYISFLNAVPKQWKKNPIFVEVPGMSRNASRELNALNDEEERLHRAIQDSERKLRKLESLRSSVADYGTAIDKQRGRLLPVGWLASRLREKTNCPICGGDSNSAKQKAVMLADAADELKHTLSSAAVADESLDTEVRRLINAIDELKVKRAIIETRIQNAEEKHIELRSARSTRDYINTYVGQLQAILESIEASSSDGEFQKKVDTLSQQVERLQKEVNPSVIRSRTDAALKKIADSISVYAKILGVEHNEQRWNLDDKNLTLTSKTTKRLDYLWEIGSAANWMGFHIATLLALHEHFRNVDHNPVPKFLIIDQPSQAFFPENLSNLRGKKKDVKTHRTSDDMERLQRLFKALSEAIKRTDNGLQIILLEHAEPNTWKGVPNFSMPDGEWRENGALIPADWM